MKAMIQSKLFKLTLKKSIQTLSNSPDKKESNNGIEHVGMQKGANFTIVFTILLIGLQRLPLTCDLSPSKESGKVAFWWTSIKEEPLELF